MQMVLLTICVAGLQFTWGVETTYVTTYLMMLGMPKAILSIVWIAGPISGLIMAPVIGVLSDGSTSRYGRRRPYMMVGSLVVSVGICGMAWAEELASLFTLGDSDARKMVALVLATAFIFLTDFAINAVQSCCRALIVDVLPPHKQELGNGWASRMIAAGHLLGYFLGFANLTKIFRGMLGDTQLKSLCVISSIALMVTVAITSYNVSERVLVRPLSSSRPLSMAQEVSRILSQLVSTMRNVPERIALILAIQFCAWYGWFTFLFYSATWVGEVFVKYGDFDDSQQDLVGEIGRKGSRLLVVFSTVSLCCTFILPELLRHDLVLNRGPSPPVLTAGSVRGWADFVSKKLKVILQTLARLLWPLHMLFEHFNINLVDLWIASHFVYALAAALTAFVTSVGQATCLMVLWGVSWSIAMWAPFSLLGSEILRLGRESAPSGATTSTHEGDAVVLEDRIALEPVKNSERDTAGEQSGIYLGIHNVAVTIPQLVSTLMSFVIFSLASDSHEQSRTSDSTGSDQRLTSGQGDGGLAIARTFQLGTFTALGAAYLTFKLKRKFHYAPTMTQE
jgi:solute carrier family 45 protein 1/2/4